MIQKISALIPSLSGGGAEKVFSLIIRHVLNAGNLNRVYVAHDEKLELSFNLNKQTKLYTLSKSKKKRAINAVFKLISLILKDKSNRFFLTLGYANLAFIIRLFRPHSKIFIRLGNTVSEEIKTLNFIKKYRYLISLYLNLKISDVVIVQSKFMKNDLINLFPKLQKKIIHIYNPIKLGNKKEYPCPYDRPYIFCASTYKYQKGIDTLLEAFSKYKQSGGERFLVIAGISRENKNVLHLIKKNNLKMSDVDLLGFKENIDAYISNADLCTLTSRYEGMSNFLLEACSFGKKIICTDSPGGNREIASSYENIHFADVDNANQIAKFFHQTRVDLNQDKAIKALSEFDESQILNQYYNILMS